MTRNQGIIAIALSFILNWLYVGIMYHNWWEGMALFILMGVISELTNIKEGASSDERHE